MDMESAEVLVHAALGDVIYYNLPQGHRSGDLLSDQGMSLTTDRESYCSFGHQVGKYISNVIKHFSGTSQRLRFGLKEIFL
jgi:hypothetical protein